MASLCLNVLRPILPVWLKRVGIWNHCPSPSFLCCLRRQPWQMIRQKRGPQDRSRISTSEDHEVRYWSQKFSVSPERLKAAVKKVGNSAKAVEKELKAGVAS